MNLDQPWDVIVVAVVVVAALVWLCWGQASRIDRLHTKVAASSVALDAQLVRRAAAARDLATSGLLDPASAVLVSEAATRALEEPPTLGVEREQAESDLSAVLRAALAEPDVLAAAPEVAPPDAAGVDVVQELGGAWYRAQLARRFHNEGVVQVQRRRRTWWVRALRLAGRAPLPQTVELDDALPEALRRAAAPAAAPAPGRPGPATRPDAQA